MNKKQGLLFVTALTLLLGIVLATSSASPGVVIYAFDQNPVGSDEGTERVTIHNPSNESVEIDNWTLENAAGERETIPEGTTVMSTLNCRIKSR